MRLIIGNQNYSSWSMRPWILLRHFKLDFEEVRIPLFVDAYQDRLREYSPTLKVPVLLDNDVCIWDSLAILEYLSEKYLDGRGFPESQERRGVCRSYCSEMHSGFVAIRTALPMNCRASRSTEISEEVKLECQRIDSLWSQAIADSAGFGDYLFGDFSLADCMFAPVAMRFKTYGIQLSKNSQKYVETLLNNLAIVDWLEDAKNETETLSEYEIG